MNRSLFLVANPQTWVADDLRPAAEAVGLTLVHSHGLDLPEVDVEVLAGVWTSAAFAARMVRAGAELTLTSPGPLWLAAVPAELAGRAVWAGRMHELARSGLRAGYAKVAEAKVPELPARWWDDLDDFTAAAGAAGLTGSSWVQVADRRLDIDLEVRSFIADGTVRAASIYLFEGVTDLSGDAHDALSGALADARRFAGEVAATLDGPGGYVLDVARCADERTWRVLEANPPWCSGLYRSQPAGVLDTVLAACRPDSRWRWEPDPVLVARAASRPLLTPGGHVRVCDRWGRWMLRKASSD